MSGFSSRFKSIEHVQFEPIPARPVSVVRAVRFDRTSAILGSDGVIYTDAVSTHVRYNGASSRHADLFKCCVKLRVLSANVVRQHNEIEDARSKTRHARWSALQVKERGKELGLRFTKAQQTTIDAAIADGQND